MAKIPVILAKYPVWIGTKQADYESVEYVINGNNIKSFLLPERDAKILVLLFSKSIMGSVTLKPSHIHFRRLTRKKLRSIIGRLAYFYLEENNRKIHPIRNINKDLISLNDVETIFINDLFYELDFVGCRLLLFLQSCRERHVYFDVENIVQICGFYPFTKIDRTDVRDRNTRLVNALNILKKNGIIYDFKYKEERFTFGWFTTRTISFVEIKKDAG